MKELEKEKDVEWIRYGTRSSKVPAIFLHQKGVLGASFRASDIPIFCFNKLF